MSTHSLTKSFAASVALTALSAALIYLLRLETIFRLDLLLGFAITGLVLQKTFRKVSRAHLIITLGIILLTMMVGIKNTTLLTFFFFGFYSLAHIPLSYQTRLTIIITTTCLIALIYSGVIDIPFTIDNKIIAIAGSAFMFRMIYYLYELKHDSSIKWSLSNFSYFFLFPNFTIPLFPIIDFKLFRKSEKQSSLHS